MDSKRFDELVNRVNISLEDMKKALVDNQNALKELEEDIFNILKQIRYE